MTLLFLKSDLMKRDSARKRDQNLARGQNLSKKEMISGSSTGSSMILEVFISGKVMGR